MNTHTGTSSRLTRLLALAVTVTVTLATLGLLVTASPAHAARATTTVDGITYVADDTNVSAGATITDYDPTVGGKVVVIPETVTIDGISYPVTAIANYGFYNNQLTEVAIGDNVTTIGAYAFDYNQLTQVTLGDAVTMIGENAFYNNQLTEVTIGDNVTIIGAYAFRENQLAQVTIGDAVTTIGAFAFASNQLTEVTIGDAVTTIGDQAFQDNQLTQITIGDAVTSIGIYAFASNRLTEVTIGDAVTMIGDGAFMRNQLTQVALGAKVATIGTYAFASNQLTEVTIGDTVTTLGTAAFASNDGLTEVTFTGLAPARIIAAGSSLASLGTAVGLVVYYPAVYGAPGMQGGYTTPLWYGYTTQPIINVYTVTFDSAGGSPVIAATVNEGDLLLAPADPTCDGYTFTGWYTNADATDAYDFDTPVTGNLTLYAGWTISEYTVTFDTGGGSTISPVTVEHGNPTTAPADPTRDGYTFTGWYTDAGATTNYDFATPVTGALTLYAGWEQVMHTVTFDTAGGNTIAPATIGEGDPVPAPADPTRDGYTFTGWHTDPGTTTLYDFTTAVTEDVTLYAGWAINEYTVTFDTGGGSTIAPITVGHGNPVTAPADPTRDGYTFTGWYTDEDTTTVYDFTTPITENVTLYAGWEINEYTITFDTGEGTTVAPVKVKYGEPATAPADPTRDGHAFTGWYAEEDAIEAYDFTSPVTGHVTLYAGWDKVAVEVPPSVIPPGTAMLPTTGGVFDPWLPLAALPLLAAGLTSIALRRFKQKRAR